MSHQSDATGFVDPDGVLAEQQRADVRVVEEAIDALSALGLDGVTCTLCGEPVNRVGDAVVIKASENAPSRIAHRQCEDDMEAMIRSANRFGSHGARGLRGSGLHVVRSPRD